MVTRRVAVILEGTSTSLVRSFEQASAAADRAGDRISRVGTHVEQNAQAYERAGTMIAGFGAATLAAQGASAAAAISWESDFAGVKKTVDDTAEGYAELSGELRQMATELPATHGEIAGVAEAAGQLGIARENITAFTATMIDLGETTNMTADEAATALARFSNIMGTSQDEVSNLGSSIVELGNNYATTEREIVEMGLRLAGAGRQARLSEGEVLGLATALSSVGIEAQAGGTAFSRVIIEMGVAVDTNSDKLRTFADVSGMTAEQFSTAWRDDAGTAIAAFVGGLGEMESAGVSIQPILEDLGMTDIRVGDALRRASSASDIFTEAMRTGNEAYAENVALTEEAAQRYETVGSQLGVLKNNVVDAGISMGEVFLPAISALAEEGGLALRAISDLPEPLRQIAGWGGAAAGGAALLTGGLMLLAPRAMETYRALQQIGVVGPRASRALRNVAGFMTSGWGLAVAGAVAALGFFIREKQKQKEAIDEVRGTLDDETGALTANTREWVAKTAQESGALDLADQLGLSHGVLTNAVMGSASAQATLNDALEGAEALGRANIATQLEKKYDGMRSSIEGATAEQERMNAEMESGARTTEHLAIETQRLTAQAEAYMGSQEGVNAAVRDWIPMQERAAALGEEAADAYAAWATEMAGFSEGFVSMSGALQAANQASQEWAQAQADATDSVDDSWEDFWDGQSLDVDAYIAELERMVEAQAAWEQNMVMLSGQVSQGVLDELARMGPEGAVLAQALIDDTTGVLAGQMEAAFGDEARAGSAAFAAAMADAAPILRAAASLWGQDIADEIAVKLAEGEMTAAEVVAAYNLQATIALQADPTQFEDEVAFAVQTANDAEATATILGNDDPLQGVVAAAMMMVNLAEGTATIDGNPDPIRDKLDTVMEEIRGSTEAAKIDGDPELGLAALGDLMRTIRDSTESAKVDANTQPGINSVFGLMAWVARQSATVDVYTRHVGGLNLGGSNRLMNSAVETGGIFDRGVRKYAGGGIDDQGRHVERRTQFAGPMYGKKNILWAEDSTRRELYLSDHPSYQADNVRYLAIAAGWYGKKVVDAHAKAYATGHVDHDRHTRATYAPPITSAPPIYARPAAAAPRGDISIAVPVQTTVRADPVAIGAEVAWQVGGLP